MFGSGYFDIVNGGREAREFAASPRRTAWDDRPGAGRGREKSACIWGTPTRIWRRAWPREQTRWASPGAFADQEELEAFHPAYIVDHPSQVIQIEKT